MLLNGDRQEQRIQLDTLLEAYSEFGDFDLQELKLIEPLRVMRMVIISRGLPSVGRILLSLRLFHG